MQLGGRKGIRSVKTWGGYGGGVAISSVGVAPTWTVSASASIFFLCSTKPRRFFMMAYNNFHFISRVLFSLPSPTSELGARQLCGVVVNRLQIVIMDTLIPRRFQLGKRNRCRQHR